jgi:hypothetical protein
MRVRNRWRTATIAAISALGVLLLIYLLRIATLWVSATEGDVPAASLIPLPNDATMLSEELTCGSGGCAIVLEVRPPAGWTADELVHEFPESLPGTLLDPRTVWLTPEVEGNVVRVRADLWSGAGLL